MRSFFLFSCLFFSSLLQSEIIETDHFNEIIPYLSSDTLILVDVDDTLLVPVQMLGCDEWFCSRLDHYLKQGCNKDDSLDKSLAEWEAVRHLTKMEIVEPGSDAIVASLQKQHYLIMGFTTQGLALATRTSRQLEDVGINFTLSAPSDHDCYLSVDDHGVLFRNGTLFTSGTHKGRALFAFLDDIGYTPKKIIFINDKASHLRPVEESAKQRGIEFIGLRYTYSDARKALHDKEVADYQFSHSTFMHILSDQEAKEALCQF